jgi:hypothetical protein
MLGFMVMCVVCSRCTTFVCAERRVPDKCRTRLVFEKKREIEGGLGSTLSRIPLSTTHLPIASHEMTTSYTASEAPRTQRLQRRAKCSTKYVFPGTCQSRRHTRMESERLTKRAGLEQHSPRACRTVDSFALNAENSRECYSTTTGEDSHCPTLERRLLLYFPQVMFVVRGKSSRPYWKADCLLNEGSV